MCIRDRLGCAALDVHESRRRHAAGGTHLGLAAAFGSGQRGPRGHNLPEPSCQMCIRDRPSTQQLVVISGR